MSNSYLGNPRLKRAGVKISYTQEQFDEYVKCAQDPEYFIENYVKIVNVDRGLIRFEMYPYQKQMVNTFNDNRFTICKLPRQAGKSTTVTAYMLWLILFTDQQSIAILANKGRLANDMLAKIQLAYEHLPFWLQQGVTTWNKGNIELENGSKILAAATSSSAVRGGSYNLIFLDEFAFIQPNIAEQFFSSVYPTISSGQTTKIIIVSTPNGLNHYYKMWMDAIESRSMYKTIDVHWSDVPGRDEKWKEETIKNTSEEQFRQEFECLDGDTIIELMDKKTKEIYRARIKDLYEIL
jgi:phage terminase large subunit GpA-like protein